jgi:hypothetical protein
VLNDNESWGNSSGFISVVGKSYTCQPSPTSLLLLHCQRVQYCRYLKVHILFTRHTHHIIYVACNAYISA